VHCKAIPSKQFWLVIFCLWLWLWLGYRISVSTFWFFFPKSSALKHAGYRFSMSHCEPESYKTDAPFDVIWDIIKCWVCFANFSLIFTWCPSRRHFLIFFRWGKIRLRHREPQTQKLKQFWARNRGLSFAVYYIFVLVCTREFFSTFSFEANFTIFPEAELESRKKKLLRFVKMDVCGPMARPKKEWDRLWYSRKVFFHLQIGLDQFVFLSCRTAVRSLSDDSLQANHKKAKTESIV
jgi:N2,N2-dimethylguanosine tRNA methyltransferase